TPSQNKTKASRRRSASAWTAAKGLPPATRQMNMNAKPQPEQSVQEEQIRAALKRHWQASAAGNANAEHDIYDDEAICDYPQSGERILGRRNLQALRSHHPGKPSGFQVKRILGNGDLWSTEYTIT